MQVRSYALTPGLHKMEREECFTRMDFTAPAIWGRRINFVGRDGEIIKSASANLSPAEVVMETQQLDGMHPVHVVTFPMGSGGRW